MYLFKINVNLKGKFQMDNLTDKLFFYNYTIYFHLKKKCCDTFFLFSQTNLEKIACSGQESSYTIM